MFEIPGNQENLMSEYKELIIKKLNVSGHSTQEILRAVPPLSDEDLSEIIDETEIPVFCGKAYFDTEVLKDFVESRIGEEFVVLEGLEDHIFCLHTVEDFVKDLLFPKKNNVIKFNKVRSYEFKEAA